MPANLLSPATLLIILANDNKILHNIHVRSQIEEAVNVKSRVQRLHTIYEHPAAMFVYLSLLTIYAMASYDPLHRQTLRRRTFLNHATLITETHHSGFGSTVTVQSTALRVIRSIRHRVHCFVLFVGP